LKTLTLCLQCLRRNVDGTPIEDSSVELRLEGVDQITAFYSPANILVKPSEFEPHDRITLADLQDWPHGGVEARLSINSGHAEFEMETSCFQDVLVGETVDQARTSPLRIHVFFQSPSHGLHTADTNLFIACDAIEPFFGGMPLDIKLWQSQFDAWWAAWREHWSAKDEDNKEEDATIEDTFIPSVPSDWSDLSYRPPSASPFLVSATDIPAELLKTIEDFHTGMHERDWSKMAAADPFFDQGPEERAACLRDRFLGDEFGRWIYVRHIDGWWCEGNRACVVVRGIEHTKEDENSTATNEETVVTYGLRRFRQNWVIATWSQGWPKYGSAEKLEGKQSWRESWNLIE
ncbi:MAG: hypothetical protein ACREHD_27965, partial [Pirellulales bacterium]